MYRPMQNDHLNIASNLEAIEFLKAELSMKQAKVYKALLKRSSGKEELISQCAELIMVTYLLAKRCGIDFAQVDEQLMRRLHLGIIEEELIETEFADLSNLKRHLSSKKTGV